MFMLVHAHVTLMSDIAIIGLDNLLLIRTVFIVFLYVFMEVSIGSVNKINIQIK